MGTGSPATYRSTLSWYREFPYSSTRSSTLFSKSDEATSLRRKSYSCLLPCTSPSITIEWLSNAPMIAWVASSSLIWSCAFTAQRLAENRNRRQKYFISVSRNVQPRLESEVEPSDENSSGPTPTLPVSLFRHYQFLLTHRGVQ